MKTAEEILKRYETYVSQGGTPIFLQENVVKAMNEWASLVSEEKDRRIRELEEALVKISEIHPDSNPITIIKIAKQALNPPKP